MTGQPTEQEEALAKHVWGKINMQNMQGASQVQQQKQLHGQRTWIDIFSKEHTQADIKDKTANIINNSGNANQNYNELLAQTHTTKPKVWKVKVEVRTPCAVGRNVNDIFVMEKYSSGF